MNDWDWASFYVSKYVLAEPAPTHAYNWSGASFISNLWHKRRPRETLHESKEVSSKSGKEGGNNGSLSMHEWSLIRLLPISDPKFFFFFLTSHKWSEVIVDWIGSTLWKRKKVKKRNPSWHDFFFHHLWTTLSHNRRQRKPSWIKRG